MINKKRFKKLFFVSAGLVCFFWYAANRTLFFKAGVFERIASGAVYPFIWISSNIVAFVKNSTEQKKTYAELQQEHKQLKKTYEALQAAFVMLHSTIHFNQETEEILEFKKRFSLSNSILAKILVKNISSEEHSVTLNCGARDGVKKDMVAIYKLQIVGKLVQVTDYYSTLQLITDARCKVAAHTNASGAGGIVVGTNTNNLCQFNYVSYINTIQPDDLIFSSGQGMVFPEGFCLGKISKLVTKDKALYHEIEVTPLVDLTALTYCLLTDQAKITLF